jgi:poly-gamma-glutamate capsule biosynthesis protein CapA/YwtB (metallophosphatase superfamily)
VAARIALLGDTMLGRGVGETLRRRPPGSLVDSALLAALEEADLVLLNLECCIAERGRPFPGRVFHFRAPPEAVDLLLLLGVDCVTLANNHALDFGPEALLDTFHYLHEAGIAWVGAGRDLEQARAPLLLSARDLRLAVLGVTDHPPEYAAAPGRPGVAYADLERQGAPDWLRRAIAGADADAVLVTPHWGPNMVQEPVAHVRRAAAELVQAGAALVAGHSAHVFHGVQGRVLYDLGDFLDDYRVDPDLRNDLGLLWLVDLDRTGPRRLEALPLKLDYCYTRLASGADADWVRRRFRAACAALGTVAREEHGRLVVSLPASG